jgi:hypothetical protein
MSVTKKKSEIEDPRAMFPVSRGGLSVLAQ